MTWFWLTTRPRDNLSENKVSIAWGHRRGRKCWPQGHNGLKDLACLVSSIQDIMLAVMQTHYWSVVTHFIIFLKHWPDPMYFVEWARSILCLNGIKSHRLCCIIPMLVPGSLILWLFSVFVFFLAVVMFSFVSISQVIGWEGWVKRLTWKIMSEMTCRSVEHGSKPFSTWFITDWRLCHWGSVIVSVDDWRLCHWGSVIGLCDCVCWWLTSVSMRLRDCVCWWLTSVSMRLRDCVCWWLRTGCVCDRLWDIIRCQLCLSTYNDLLSPINDWQTMVGVTWQEHCSKLCY